MEMYFSHGEFGNILADIIEKPNNYELWFEVFEKIIKNNKVNKLKLDNLKMSVLRTLESYKNNTAFNLMIGLIGILQNDFKIEETNCYLYLYDRYFNRNLEESWFSSGKFLLQGELMDNDTKREPIILVLDDEMLVCELLFDFLLLCMCVLRSFQSSV
jgi:hypothetical protein